MLPEDYPPTPEQWRQVLNDLDLARMTIIDLMPQAARDILRSYYSKPDDQSAWRWAQLAAERICDICTDVQQQMYQGYPLGSPRAKCPLCGSGPNSYYETGFAIPDGLTRHLLGTYNAHGCGVLEAARALAQKADARQARPASKRPNWSALPGVSAERKRPYKPRKKPAV